MRFGIIIFIIVFAALGLWFFSGSRSTLNKSIRVKSTAAAANRFIADYNGLKKWWPGQAEAGSDTVLNYKGAIYKLAGYQFNTANIIIRKKAKDFSSIIVVVPATNDSVDIIWKAHDPKNNDFLNTITAKGITNNLEKEITELLDKLKELLQQNEKIYGLAINEVKVTDTVLLSTRFTTPHYPSPSEVYDKVYLIKNEISRLSLKQVNPVMLNARKDNTGYLVTIAIPVNKQIESKPPMEIKRMIPGKILVTQIQGGESAIQNGFAQLRLYINDHHLESPAMPFQSLITNRIEEKDTAKWITKVYYPIY